MMGEPMGGNRGPGRGQMMRGGPMAGMMRGDKPADFSGTMGKLINYMGRYKYLVVVVVIFAIASTAANIFGPKILGNATTTLVNGLVAQIAGTGSIDFGQIGTILLQVLALYIISSVCGFIQGWIMAGVATNTTYRMRREIAEKINKLPLKYFDNTTHGEVLSRISNNVDTINQSLSQSITQIITSVVTIIGVLYMMFTISWALSVLSLIILPDFLWNDGIYHL